jgi:hypothetical protein
VLKKEIEVIDKCCFSSCKLRELLFATGTRIERLEARAFCDQLIKTVTIPSTVKFIGDRCFYSCVSLSEVVFEENSQLKEIGVEAFSKSHIAQIDIPSDCEVLRKGCFDWCECLVRVTFQRPSRLREIEDRVFRMSKMTGMMMIPASVEVVGKECFPHGSQGRVRMETGSRLILGGENWSNLRVSNGIYFGN